MDTHDPLVCARCNGRFANEPTFELHIVPASDDLPIATCLDVYERIALGWTRQKRGTWAVNITTDVDPSAIRRLASIRQLEEAFVRDGIPGLEAAMARRDRETNALIRVAAASRPAREVPAASSKTRRCPRCKLNRPESGFLPGVKACRSCRESAAWNRRRKAKPSSEAA